MTDVPASAQRASRLPRMGLSAKLLLLTILFVMVAEVLIYVPSVANYRLAFLSDRLTAAYTAALVLDKLPQDQVSDQLARDVLASVGARMIAMKTGNQRRLLAVSDMPSKVDHEVDVRNVPWYKAVFDAFDTLLSTDNDVILAVGPAPKGAGGDDAEGAAWLDARQPPELAFDHDKILAAALDWLKDRNERG